MHTQELIGGCIFHIILVYFNKYLIPDLKYLILELIIDFQP